jgi:putative flippase GtrA
VIATVCSEVVFLALYGPAHAGTTVASVVGWLAGAVPNYWLNRSWAWRRSGRPSLHGELLPYVVIVLVTLLLATVSTGLADRLLQGAAVSESLRWALVGGTFLAVYGVLFVVRFLLLDRLFRRDPHPAQEGMSDG